MRKSCFISVTAAMLGLVSVSYADMTFENDLSGWLTASGGASADRTINWDDVSSLTNGTSTVIAANRYTSSGATAKFGNPMLSIAGGNSTGLHVGNPDNPSGGFFGPDFFPVSGSNVFSPNLPGQGGSPTGILTITFDTPMRAIGAWFLDVEGDHASTGIRVGGTLYAFSANQGDNSASFFGITTDVPFTTVDLVLNNSGGGNGIGLDDVSFSTVPSPTAGLLGIIGLISVVWARRRID